MRTILINLIIASSISMAGCSVYKVDIRQGNELAAKQIAKLEIGMTQQQVSFVMGNPLLTDPFHQNRWDYLRTYRQGGEKTTRQLLTLYFDGDKLVKIDDSQLEKQELEY